LTPCTWGLPALRRAQIPSGGSPHGSSSRWSPPAPDERAERRSASTRSNGSGRRPSCASIQSSGPDAWWRRRVQMAERNHGDRRAPWPRCP
jgi:hypothetical protein